MHHFIKSPNLQRYVFTVFLCFSYAFSKPVLSAVEVAQTSPPQVTTTVTEYKVYLDETLVLGDLAVEFTSVSDSRCPRTTQCIWAGEAEIIVLLKEKGKSPKVKEITITPDGVSPEYVKNVLLYKNNAVKIALRDLKPYPDASKPYQEKDYYIVVTAAEI